MKTFTVEVDISQLDGFYVFDNKGLNYFHHWATWRIPTYKYWNKVLGKDDCDFSLLKTTPAEMEYRIWKYLLLDTSLVPEEITVLNEEGETTDEALSFILNTIPPQLPQRLQNPIITKSQLTQKELNRIEQECYTLWCGKGSSVADPHPLVEKVVNAMGMHERFGIPVYKDADDIPQREYAAMRYILMVYGKIMDLNETQRALKGKSERQALPRR